MNRPQILLTNLESAGIFESALAKFSSHLESAGIFESALNSLHKFRKVREFLNRLQIFLTNLQSAGILESDPKSSTLI